MCSGKSPLTPSSPKSWPPARPARATRATSRSRSTPPACSPAPLISTASTTAAKPRRRAAPRHCPPVRLAVFSCAAYALGQFHAYADAVNRGDFDVALMLGDYIYETGLSNAEQLAAFLIGREIDPQGELHTLSEYRQRYARYHTDADLRALRATMPVIAVWDDHDIANDLWRSGIGGQNLAADASFIARRAAAVQAWHEWLPTRDGAEPFKISRSFDFGN